MPAEKRRAVVEESDGGVWRGSVLCSPVSTALKNSLSRAEKLQELVPNMEKVTNEAVRHHRRGSTGTTVARGNFCVYVASQVSTGMWGQLVRFEK